MIVRFSDAEKFESEEGEIWDYPVGKNVGLSYQTLKSRGPEQGYYLNRRCREVYFIISGEAKFIVGQEESSVGPKGVVVVEPGVAHAIETKGLEYLTITSPDWYEEQAEVVAEITK